MRHHSHRLLFGAFAFLTAVFLTPSQGRAGSLRAERVEHSALRQRVARRAPPRMFPGGSRRQLIPRQRGTTRATLRVLAIRVDFPPPDPGDVCGISGDGMFDLSGQDTPDRYPGAPPHNKRYFEGVLEALARYYAVQSYGAVTVEYRVTPDEDDGAYRMPHRTAWYSYYLNSSDLQEREKRLARLGADALKAVDSDSSVVVSDFDAYIVFHAGGDWQHDYNGDSPCDLITAYIPSLTTLLGAPVMVDDSTHAVDDLIVMPEAIHQDLDPSREIACIHSELAHEFGHQLGLLDLYDYSYWSNVVGYWALMDNGDGMAFQDQHGRVLTGVLPPSLCVFSKILLGWVVPDELGGDGQYSITATTLAPSAYRITLSDTEHFLIENRQGDTDGDPAVYLKTDHGVILGPSSAESDSTTSEYDAGLPGSGMLLWHVDTTVGLWEWGLPNYLEYDADADTLIRHRGVALEEADGVEDIGLQYYEAGSNPPGTVAVDPAGGPDDPFRSGNNDRFGDDSRPASWNNAARLTHVEVSDISPAGPTMTFTFQRTWRQEGWPVSVSQGPLTVPNVMQTSSGEPVILVAGRGRIFTIGEDRQPRQLWDSFQQVVNPPAAFLVEGEQEALVAAGAQGGRLVLFPLRGSAAGVPLSGWPVTPTGRALSTPVLADLDGDGAVEVAVGSADGRACLLNLDAQMAAGWPVVLSDSAVGPPAVADVDGDGRRDLVFCADGVHALAMDGSSPSGWPALQGHPGLFEPLIADLEGDGGVDIVVGSVEGVWVLGGDGQVRQGWPVTPGAPLTPPVLIFDIDGDGALDIAATDGAGGIWAWSSAGHLLTDCMGSRPPGPTVSVLSLMAFDATGDGLGDFLCVGGHEADLRQASGHSLSGWPLSVQSATGASALDLDGDGDLEIVVADSLGSLHAWDLPYEALNGWFLPRGDAAMTGWAGAGTTPSRNVDLIEADEFYCWPSPVAGGHATISFRARPGAVVSLTILDAAGRSRSAWQGTASGQRQDWRWEARLPMGVYLCRLEARDGGASTALIHRFAIVGEE